MNEKLVKIDWSDVQAGDVLMHENGDRLTVQASNNEWIVTLSGTHIAGRYVGLELSGFSPYRKQPELPTEPGAYLDKDGDPWILLSYPEEEDMPWIDPDGDLRTDLGATYHAPFTRLVPMPTEERVYETIERATGDQFIGAVHPATTAVMALLRGDKQEVQS